MSLRMTYRKSALCLGAQEFDIAIIFREPRRSLVAAPCFEASIAKFSLLAYGIPNGEVLQLVLSRHLQRSSRSHLTQDTSQVSQ